jgi:iron complex transport system substrate-binding protein
MVRSGSRKLEAGTTQVQSGPEVGGAQRREAKPNLSDRDWQGVGNIWMVNQRHTLFREVACAMALAGLLMLPGCHGRAVSKSNGSAGPQRFISLSPGVTEILYGIGAFPSLVADSEYCDYPEEAKRLPHVGGFFDVNLESVAAFHPSLIILIQDQEAFLKSKFDDMSIPVLIVRNHRVNEIVDSIRIIGRETGHQSDADVLADSIAQKMEQRSKETAGLAHPKVLCVIDHVPGTLRDVYVASGDSFLGDLIKASGGNCFSIASQNGYAKVQQEAIVDYNPDIIIDVVHKTGPDTSSANATLWRQLPQLQAVKEGRVISVSQPTLVHPSQLLAGSLDALSKMIHPEVFGPYEQ